MEETQTELCELIKSIDNPKILRNLHIIVTDYVNYYMFNGQQQKSVED